MSWLDDTAPLDQGRFISCKEGQSVSFVVKSVQKMVGEQKFAPKNKAGVGQGWWIRLTDTEGRIMDVGSYALQSAIRNAAQADRANPFGPLTARSITIRHPGRGQYVVELGDVVKADDTPF